MTRRTLAILLSLLLLSDFAPAALACGPGLVEPVFVFTESPDLPFADFTRGKIGIVQPTFGAKTLVIAYRYLNGGSFTAGEQTALVDALRGTAPDDDGGRAIKAWIALRKEFLREGEKLPAIYPERKNTGYDFFPNCAKNAFEVATATLKQRAASYGSEDRNLREWLAAQDIVFQNCSGGATLPAEPGPESPLWLRKDREYQMGAALFYSLNLEAAQARFENIAADGESPWQHTADYLVARTMVRRASLTGAARQRREAYEQAEVRLQMVLASNGEFYDAALRLSGMIKFRAHPERRIRELGRVLAETPGNTNLRQDLIDYVWLRDKFQSQFDRAERQRKEASAGIEKQKDPDSLLTETEKATREAVQRGELIEIMLYLKGADGQSDYSKSYNRYFKYDVSDAEILLAFESELGRKLAPEEIKDIQERHASAIENRNWIVSPNRRVVDASTSRDEDCPKDCATITVDQLNELLHGDDLSDWVSTMQSSERTAYAHALAKWRQTAAPTWLLAALTRAETSSTQLERLLRAAEKIPPDDPVFPSLAYHLIRLKTGMQKPSEARQLVDEILAWPTESLPVSARNQFIEQRMKLAADLTEFLKFAARRPVVFSEEGNLGTISELMKISKARWNPEYYGDNKEEYEREIDERYKSLLPWEDQTAFDEATVDAFNWHFPVAILSDAARSRSLPKYLRRQLVLAVWTRAVLLGDEAVAQQAAPAVTRVAPEMAIVVDQYLNARTATERKRAALYVLLKFPNLTPFVPSGMPTFVSAEESLYYFEGAWWCPVSTTEYKDGGEVAKVVPPPGFLNPSQLEAARKELGKLSAMGDGKSYLGKQVIEWAKESPGDPRIPEALFIAVKANESYKYGCSSWDNDEDTREKAATILQQRYPHSPWTTRLHEDQN